ncbi:LuxR C-terminal-related transcriptional regulator [Kribbella sp. CA-293567]|uniref:LuxR C-terminal-related transcriptional regulator n=1 Tax=Kribbella sp. CA-293567 TaxID=3002436 RepID=UPI0022DDB9F1|nr:LuxR C-terminal-related transcriptional regulator [Kribbella sp. CA-293567]WBQ07017.1 LuxR C-terminal-related transcriptional regulator [Kribbella sp. CA-293567]
MLEPLGLTRAEQDLYEDLVSRRPVTEAEVSDPAAARRLVELGLITLMPSKPPRFLVLPPDVALELLVRDRELELAKARQETVLLATQFHTGAARTEPPELIEVLRGEPEIAAGIERLIRSARSEVCLSDAPPFMTDPTQVHQEELESLREGVGIRILYDRTRSVDRPGRLAARVRGVNDGEQARVGDVPLKLLLTDGPMAFVPIDVGATQYSAALLIHDPTLVAALQTLFEQLWSRAVPLATYAGQTGSADGPTDQERDLLALLMSGLTDSETAVQLGWTERSVRSRIDRMRQRLGADTRFQAGYEAVLRGWLEPHEG